MNTVRTLLLSITVGTLILIGWGILWPYFVSSYVKFLLLLLQPFATDGTTLQVTPSEIIVYDHKGTAIVRKNLSSLNEFGLLLALFLATPAMLLSQRIRRLLLALGIQVLLHLVEIVLLIWIAYEFYFGINKQSFAYWLLNLLMAGNLIFPILLWTLLTFRSWLPKPAAPAVPSSPQPQRHPKEARP